MSENKSNPKPVLKITGEPRGYNRILVIEDSDVDFFTEETLIKNITHTQKVERNISTVSVLENIKKANKLTEIPDLILLGLSSNNKVAIKFLEDFNQLSDFIKNKCKIVVMSNLLEKDEKYRILLNPNVIGYLNKPLDAFQLKNFIINS